MSQGEVDTECNLSHANGAAPSSSFLDSGYFQGNVLFTLTPTLVLGKHLRHSPPISRRQGRSATSAQAQVILSGIIGLTTWKRPMILLVNLFVLLSVVCVLLNLAGFILGCQGAQFVSSVPRCDLVDLGEGKICFCCEEFQPAKCTDKENALKLFPVQPCSAVHLLLKKVLFALCALNALTTTVCLVAAALRYLQIFAARRSCSDESQISAEEVEEHGHIPDPDDFVPPVPPPSYFATFYSCTPRMNRRMVGPDIIPLPHIYGARIKGVEVFCPLDPPPPYEAVVNQVDQEQGPSFRIPEGSEAATSSSEPMCMAVTQGGDIPNTPGEESASISTPSSNLPHPVRSWRALQPLRTRSKSDPVLHHSAERAAPVLSCEAATQTEGRPDLAAMTLRRGLRPRASRCRPRSLIDYRSYIDTKLLVARFLEQSSCSMTPDIHELVENIKSVLKSDEEHMEEAITSASFLEQATKHYMDGCRRQIPGPHLVKLNPFLPVYSPKDNGPIAAQHFRGPLATLAETAWPVAPAELRRPEHFRGGREAPSREEAPARGG
ncbi:endosomal transmembrane epsin interactor 1 isoform X4 [Rhinolophus sinicus]|uniref:endosomal transmembrane epsin interactor 1 isoform X4 n=1 Tax=Rhinolophus sinicus TaxID=89399 RepID=UPI003D798EEB